MFPSRTKPEIQNIHASCVAAGSGGVLILGNSGQGKSDLALRLIDKGARLVADDRCDIWYDRERLWCRRHCEERSDAAIQRSVNRSGLLRFARNDDFCHASAASAPIKFGKKPSCASRSSASVT